MSFLTPLYLAGIIAVGLPILLHLVRHQPKNVLFFSSLRFLEHKPPQTNRRNKVEHWLLLSLRALAVTLLVTAFARPFFKNTDLELITAEPVKQTILLLDTSSSMRRDSLWDQAIQTAEQIVETSAQNQISIYTFDSSLHPVKPLQNLLQSSQLPLTEQVRERLRTLSPGWHATDLGQALTEMAALLQQQAISDPTGTSLQNCTIELITDFQEGSQINSLVEFSWPESLHVRLHPIQATQTSNAGLQLLALENNQPTVRILNASDSKQEQFSVAYEWHPGEPEHAQQIYVPRGQSCVLRLPVLETGHPTPLIKLSGDDHPFDNTLHFQLPKKENRTIVHYGIPADHSIQSPDYFVKRAFPSTPERKIEFLTVGPDSPQVLVGTANMDLMILSRELSSHEIQLVDEFLQQGGVALLSLNDQLSANSLKALLSQTHDSDAEIQIESAEVNGYALLTNIDFEHKLFQMFQAPEFSDFTNLKFWNYQKLSLPDNLSPQILARFDHKDPAIVSIPRGAGRLIVSTFGWTPRESQFALSTKFVPIMNAILNLKTEFNASRSQLLVGQKVKLPEPVQAVHISTPSQSKIQLAAGQQDFSETVQPGLYQINPENQSEAAHQFAVNLDINESKTAPLPVEQLEALGVKLIQANEPIVDQMKSADLQRQALVRELEQKQKLWRWLILGALALLGLETLLAKWFADKTSATRKA
ncbi:BatA domain-containing protein [Gimesia sp.]|uniref:BatA domain-containing protein n=1 Tax=Gimesia sp. TaxID=2024833 RepID=UPI003A8EF81B